MENIEEEVAEILVIKGSFKYPSANLEIDFLSLGVKALEFGNFVACDNSSRPRKRGSLINFVINGRVYR